MFQPWLFSVLDCTAVLCTEPFYDYEIWFQDVRVPIETARTGWAAR